MVGAICIRLPGNVLKEVAEIAEALDRTKSYLIRKAVEQYIEEYADYRIALDRLRNKDDAIISSKELKKRLGSKD